MQSLDDTWVVNVCLQVSDECWPLKTPPLVVVAPTDRPRRRGPRWCSRLKTHPLGRISPF